MDRHEAVATVNPAPVSTQHQFRAALARLRMLDRAKANSPEGRERLALELAVFRVSERRRRSGALAHLGALPLCWGGTAYAAISTVRRTRNCDRRINRDYCQIHFSG